MREQLQHRLGDLKAEFTKGQKKLEELEMEALRLRQTLLRISGAIQVIEEELAKADGKVLVESANDGTPPYPPHGSVVGHQ